MLELSDSAWLEFTARTAKYQVPAPNDDSVLLVALGSLTIWLWLSALALVPNSTLNPARSVSGVPLVFVVGAVQFTVALPPPHEQVSVYDLLAVIVGSVSLPEANLVPLHAPLAVQLDATGEVDQVSTGVSDPVAEVWLAVKLIVPAVCACATEPSRASDSVSSAHVSFCMPASVRIGHAGGAPICKTAAASGCRKSKNLRAQFAAGAAPG